MENDPRVREIRERVEKHGDDMAVFNREYWRFLPPGLRLKIKSIVPVATSDAVKFGNIIMFKATPIYEEASTRLMEEMMMGKGMDSTQDYDSETQTQSKGYETFRHRKQQNMCPADYGAYKKNRRR
jgi:hypothetical protein